MPPRFCGSLSILNVSESAHIRVSGIPDHFAPEMKQRAYVERNAALGRIRAHKQSCSVCAAKFGIARDGWCVDGHDAREVSTSFYRPAYSKNAALSLIRTCQGLEPKEGK